jgi:methylated-DNA-protein-cysteine methyltransferase-like protein
MDFYKRMQLVCDRIPSGKVATYGQIALLCQKPKNARQVGYGLNRGLAGENVPAHRVVNARGILSGALAFDMPDLQKLLLEEEGVQTNWTPDGWKVSLETFQWKNTIDEALQLQEEYIKRGI